MAKRKPLTSEKLLEHYTELQRRVSVGAYLELQHDGSYPPDDGTPESTTLESIHNLETWAGRQGLEFVWHKEPGTYTLEPIIASRDWHTRAHVRITAEVSSHSVDPWIHRTFHVGEELEMLQWGRKGRPVKRDSWWTSYDIDGAHIVKAENVEVIEVLEETQP